MADMSQEGRQLAVVGGHCPICSAARGLSGLLPQRELALFRRLLAPAEVGRRSSACWGTAAVSIASSRPAPERAERKTTKQAPGCLLCCLRRGALVPARCFPIRSTADGALDPVRFLHHRCLVGRLSCHRKM